MKRISFQHFLIVVLIVVLLIGSYIAFILFFQNPVVNPSIRAIYHGYGFTIQYPLGAKMQNDFSDNFRSRAFGTMG